MSKVDALRAMREAKYARSGGPPERPGTVRPASTPGAGTDRSTPRSTPAEGSGDGTSSGAPMATSALTADSAQAATADAPAPELCGHRNMGGKSCSRPAGHSEKNHRYANG